MGIALNNRYIDRNLKFTYLTKDRNGKFFFSQICFVLSDTCEIGSRFDWIAPDGFQVRDGLIRSALQLEPYSFDEL